jgi:NitT/TauT family transport system permease protein
MKILALRLAVAVTLLAAWQIVPPLIDAEFFLSTPHEILRSFWGWIIDGTLWFHAGITALEAGAGFLIGGTLGLICGLILGRFPTAADVADPFLTALYSIPKVALAPLFILWFGIGLGMKIIMAASVVFFLVFLNTLTGVREVSREQTTLLALMGAKPHHILLKVVIPSAIVWVFAGLRLSVPYALIGAIVGEIIASNRGLGYLITRSAASFDTAGTFAALIAITTLALALSAVIKAAERRLMPWKAVEKSREVGL